MNILWQHVRIRRLIAFGISDEARCAWCFPNGSFVFAAEFLSFLQIMCQSRLASQLHLDLSDASMPDVIASRRCFGKVLSCNCERAVAHKRRNLSWSFFFSRQPLVLLGLRMLASPPAGRKARKTFRFAETRALSRFRCPPCVRPAATRRPGHKAAKGAARKRRTP